MKIFHNDVETTGRYYHKHGIHHIAGIIEIDGVEAERFDFKVRPKTFCEIEQEALKVGRVTREQIMSYPSMLEVHPQLTAKLEKYVDVTDPQDKFFFSGYNAVVFDRLFMHQFFLDCNDHQFTGWFHSYTIDTMVLAGEYLRRKGIIMESYSLAKVAKRLGLNVVGDNLHDAGYDCVLSRDILKNISCHA